jgi:hypothetical protein
MRIRKEKGKPRDQNEKRWIGITVRKFSIGGFKLIVRNAEVK